MVTGPAEFMLTKIIATIGPASAPPEVLEQMIRAGMNVARLTFSHGPKQAHRARLQRRQWAPCNLPRPRSARASTLWRSASIVIW